MWLNSLKKHQKSCIFLLFFLFLCFVGYQIDLNPRMDDDYIGEQVYWLMQKGYVKTELMGGFGGIGLENYQTVFHKLWVYNGFLFCKIGGWSIFSLHCASMFYLVLFAGIFYVHIKKKYPTNTWFLYGLVAFLFLSHHELKNMAWSFRPEVMVMCLGFISYHFLSVFLGENLDKNSHKNRQIYLIGAGVFAGLAFLTHLNGLIFAGAGFILLLIQKQWKNAIIFGIFVTIIFAFYFADVLIHADLAYFWKQFSNDPSLMKSNFGLWGLGERILLEQARYLYTEKEIPLTFLLVLSLGSAWKYLKKFHTNLLNYSLLLMGIMCIWCYSKVPYLLILLLPFLTLLIALGVQYILENIEDFKEKSKKILPIMIAVAVFAHFGINSFYAFIKIKQNYVALQMPSIKQQNTQLHNTIQTYEKLPTMKDKKVLAAGDFIFEEINNFKSIKNMAQYDFFVIYHNKPKMSFKQLLDSATTHKINYIIIKKQEEDSFEIEKSYLQHQNLIETIKIDDYHWIFKVK